MNDLPRINRAELLASGLFDPEWYCAHYPDVTISGLDPLEHFLVVGIILGRRPGPQFDPEYYLSANPDVVDSGMIPLAHYLEYGWRENRPSVCRAEPLNISDTKKQNEEDRHHRSTSAPSTQEEVRSLVRLGMSQAAAEQLARTFDAGSYRRANQDLSEVSDLQARHHFFKQGALEVTEGRRSFGTGIPAAPLHDYGTLYNDVVTLYPGPCVDHYFLYGLTEIAQGTRPHYLAWPEFRLPPDDVPARKETLRGSPQFSHRLAILCPQWPDDKISAMRSALNALSLQIDIYSEPPQGHNWPKQISHVLVFSKTAAPSQCWTTFFLSFFHAVSDELLQSSSVIYWDEIYKAPDQKFDKPFLKPQFSPHYLWSTNYIGSSGVVHVGLLAGAPQYHTTEALLYHCALHASLQNTKSGISHIATLLTETCAPYHSADINADEKQALHNALSTAYPSIEVAQGPQHRLFSVRLSLVTHPLVSIIIPFRDHVDLLIACLRSILARSTYTSYEIILMDNGSSSEQLELLVNAINDPRIRIHSYAGAFNFSAINNYAAIHYCKGDFLLFLNNDTTVITPDWLERMLQHAAQPNAGAVGAKLLFPNGTVQHAGIAIGPFYNVAVCFAGASGGDPGYFGRASTTTNVIAVTAACLMVSKQKFLEVNGFNEEHLKVAYNDVDLCLKLYAQGYFNIFVAAAQLHHYESASRGLDIESPDKYIRLCEELAVVKQAYPAFFESFDPFYNINCSKILPSATFAYHERFVPSKRSEYEETICDERILYDSGAFNKSGSRLIVFSHFDRDNIVDPYVIFTLKHLSAFGDVVFVSTSAEMTPSQIQTLSPFVRRVIIKENRGYDFGAWRTGLLSVGSAIHSYKQVSLVNDSIYGPLTSLEEYFHKAAHYDVYSMTDSHDLTYHFQSYFVTFSATAVSSHLFRDFWNNFKIVPNKLALVLRNEIGFYRALIDDPLLKTGALISTTELGSHVNNTHFYWNTIIEQGFPFIKVELLRDNPRNVDITPWQDLVQSHAPQLLPLILSHLQRTKPSGRT